MKVLRKEAVYPHPVADVWTALTDPRALAEWLMPNDFQPRLGHKFRFQTDTNFFCRDPIKQCEVLEIDPPRRMVWSWLAIAEPGRPQRPPMRVEWTLTPEGSGTRLTLVHTGFEGQSMMLKFLMGFGWGGMLKDIIPKVLVNVRDGRFTPGAIPLNKRYYKAKTIPADLVC